MPEQHPDDLALLAATEDAITGATHIETGTSPYVLAFRRLIYRMLRIAERANDLRPYAEAGLYFGVRPGRCWIADQPIAFTGLEQQPLAPSTKTYVWLDANGDLQTSTLAMPANRTSFIPIAEIETDNANIAAIIDRRGESFLQTPSIQGLGLEASAEEIDQALSGIGESVTASRLTLLTSGPASTVDSFHRHLLTVQDVDGTARVRLLNDSDDPAANQSLMLGLPNAMTVAPELTINRNNGFFQQSSGGIAYDLVGVLPVQRRWDAVDASLNEQTLGCLPIAGEICAIVLSIADNMISDDTADGIHANVKLNGQIATSTSPMLTADQNGGFQCTDQGNGTAAILDTNHIHVQRGDVLTVDLVRTVNGTVSQEAGGVCVLVMVKAAGPQ